MKRQQRISNTLRQHEQLECRRLLTGNAWHNADIPTDVNRDGMISPFDALAGINELNFAGPRLLNENTQVRNSDFAYDVNDDGHLSSIDILQIINAMNAEGEGDMLIQIRLQAEDFDGNAISNIGIGETYVLSAYVQDLTAREDGGVFAAYLDVNYEASLTSTDGNLEYGSDYQNGKEGDASQPGLIDEVGAFDGFTPLGPGELQLFSIEMSADVAGLVTFDAESADIFPAHESLLFGIPEGEVDSTVPIDRIMYVDATLQIGSAANTAPTAADDAFITSEDIAIEISAPGVLNNDSDPDGDALSATLMAGPASGTVALVNDGSFTYTPNVGFIGTDSFTYVANDGMADSNVATVTIEVQSANSAPVANNDSYSLDEDTPFAATLGVKVNDTDADGDTLSVRLVDGVSHGTLGLSGDVNFPVSGLFTYIPDPDYNGVDTFTYVVNDGLVDSNVATVTLNVQPVNDAPIGADDSYTAVANASLIINAADGVLANDTDVDGDTLTATVDSLPTNGTVGLNSDGSFTYTPSSDFVGDDSFTYIVSDGELASDPVTVDITVENMTTASVLFRLETTNQSGTEITSIAPGGQFLLNIYVQDVSSIPRDGVFSAYLDVLYSSTLVSANGDITYGEAYPNGQSGIVDAANGVIDEVGAFDGFDPLGADELLVATVPFVANNPGTAMFIGESADVSPSHDITLFNESEPVSVEDVEYGSTQLIIEEGEPPVAADDEFVTSEDIAIEISAPGVLSNDSDPDGNSLTAIMVNGPTNGGLTLNSNGSFKYTPNANFFGEDAFTYVANDGAEDSNVATVRITVESVLDDPVAVDDSYDIADASDGTVTVPAENGVLRNDFDVEGDDLVAELVSSTTNGQLVFNSDGSFSYTPDNNLVGRDSFEYQVTAGDRVSRVATVTLNIGDLTPSSLSGFVYIDANNNGVKNEGELTLSGVDVVVVGTNLLGEHVRMTTETTGDGSYVFDGLLRGNYTVIERQPIFMIDGLDTVNRTQSLRNDRFIVDLAAGTEAGDYNFGERGLEARFLSNPLFFTSRSKTGVLAAIGPDGEQAWQCFDAGWNNLVSIDIDLSANGSTAELTGVETDGDTIMSTVRVSGNSAVRVLGDMVDGMLIRLNGTDDDYGLDPDSVDDAFLDIDG